MKLSRLFSALVLGCICIGFMQQAVALTVGKVRGSAFLGKTLNITVPLQFAPGEDVGDHCADAEVFFGEALVERSQTTAKVEAASLATGGGSLLRVTTLARVDEPVVTVYVQTGCKLASTRKFVLLTDVATLLEPEPVEPVRALAQGSPAGALPEGSAASAVGAPRSGAVQGRSLAPMAASAARKKSAPSVVEPSGVTVKSPVVRERSKGRARLEVLPLDLTVDWEPRLKMGALELSTPTEDPQLRAQAAALWRALNASPEEVLRASSQLEGLEKNVQILAGQIQSNQQLLVDMQARVRTAQDQRYSNPLVWALGALVFALSAALAFMWRRNGVDAAPWWAGSTFGAKGERTPHAGVVAEKKPAVVLPARVGKVKAPVAPMDSGIDIPLSDSDFVQDKAALATPSAVSLPPDSRLDAAPSGHSDFAHSVTGSLRAINTQELVDVRQQADFFLALGQHDEAIRVLQNGIGQSGDSNPMIFLDLVAILHNLGRRDEYEQIRGTFNALYTGHIPPFVQYNMAGDGLLAYQGICDRIAKLWPTDSAMEYIENCLVRDATDALDRGFDLCAFRDLLMLHGIVGKIVVPQADAKRAEVSLDRVLPLVTVPLDPEMEIVTRSGGL